MDSKSTPSIPLAAHHEAGHALICHLCGWSIEEIGLTIGADGLPYGYTKYNLGEDEKFFPEVLDISAMSESDKKDFFRPLIDRYKVVLGGPYAQAHYEDGSGFEYLDVVVRNEDEQKVLLFNDIHRSLYNGSRIDYHGLFCADVADSIRTHWSIIVELAELICKSKDYKVSKAQVYAIFSKINI